MPHIQQAVMHALDPNASMPIFSNQLLDLGTAAEEYLTALVDNFFESDAGKLTRFMPEAGFPTLLTNLADNFIPASCSLAEEIFKVMQKNPAIPAGDLLCMLVQNEGLAHLVVMKLPFRSSFSHYFQNDTGSIAIIKQQTLLPAVSAKIDEGFIINLQTLDITLTEKKYEIDGNKAFYLSAYILGCTDKLAEREKFTKIRRSVEKINNEYFSNDTGIESHAAVVLRNQLEGGQPVPVQQICQEIYTSHPEAAEKLQETLERQHISGEDTVQVSPKTVKRLEKQSLKSAHGIEIKIPVDLYRNTDSLEFVNNPDGTITLVIKDVIV